MIWVSRDNNLKIPKQIEIYEKSSNSVDDAVAVKKAMAIANDKKLNTKELKEKVEIKCYVRYMDDMILIHRDKQYLNYCKNKIDKLCNELLDLKLNQKTQIGIVKNGIDFLGYIHILTGKGRIIVKLRYSSKQRMEKQLKTINKLYNKGIVDDEYVYSRKNAFYNHIKTTNESQNLIPSK